MSNSYWPASYTIIDKSDGEPKPEDRELRLWDPLERAEMLAKAWPMETHEPEHEYDGTSGVAIFRGNYLPKVIEPKISDTDLAKAQVLALVDIAKSLRILAGRPAEEPHAKS